MVRIEARGKPDTENEHEIRILSFRKATNREALIFFNEIQH